VAAIPSRPRLTPTKHDDLTLKNRDGRFSPHVQLAPLGASILVSNLDPFTHNARITGRGNRQFWNALLPPQGEAKTASFESPGLYTIFCDMHPWMKAYLIVTDQPSYGLSQADGVIRLTELPSKSGQVVDLWHETLGRARITLDLLADKENKHTMTQTAFKR
jgi:plastocyanin